jgi:hypothetical protein
VKHIANDFSFIVAKHVVGLTGLVVHARRHEEQQTVFRKYPINTANRADTVFGVMGIGHVCQQS